MDIEAYFERIGYKNSANKLNLDTLTKVLQHQMRTVPFENLNMHCGEAMDLGLEATFDHIVRKKRGGWCLQANHLLYWALTKMGFETTMLGGYVYILPVNKYSSEMIHLLVQVTISDRNYIVDAAYGGSYQMWEPLELASGKDQPQAPAIFRLTEEHGTWYLDQIRREQYVPNQEFVNSDLLEKNEYRKIYSFTLEPRTIEDFEYANAYLQTSSSSVFVNTSFCSLQTSEGVCCLIGSIIARRKFSYKDNVDLVEFKNVREEEIEDILKTAFGVSLERKFVPKKDARDGTMDIEAYFERIGYQNSRNKLDLQTLTEILQHQIRAIPFENLNIHCGESMELSLEAIFDQIVRKKRGGWCLQVNHLLYWALTKMGFETTMLGGYVFNTPANKYSSGMIHLLVQVTISGKGYIVDAGFGRSYQMWEPLELASGKDQPQVPAIFRLTEEHGTWYLDQIRREQYVPNQEFVNSDLLEKNEYRKIYSFTLKPRSIEDFESMNIYLQTSPASVFTSKSFCSLQTPEGVHCLVGSTLTYRKFSYRDNVDLVEFKSLKEEEIEDTLKTIFGVSLERKLVPKHGDKFFTI